MVAAETYLQWYGELIARPFYALSAEGIASYWSISHAHPPLSKLWSGFVWWGARRLFDDLTAHRLGNMLMAGGLVSLLFFMVRRHYGRTAGLVAAFALLTMPRFFFHAHLATIDVPVTAMIFAVMYVGWPSQPKLPRCLSPPLFSLSGSSYFGLGVIFSSGLR
jgi:4-amino-4-deoxy-L-arabinose transferase-like glycosyltransferase